MSEVNQLANSLNEFSLELYRNISKEPSTNLFFSPYSIMAALTMTLAGARNNTADQMSQVLRLNQFKGSNVHKAFQQLNDVILSPNSKITLKSANRLYGQKDYIFLKSFFETLLLHYKAQLMPVDFETGSDDARKEINDWVSKETNNKINDLIAPGVLDSLTVLVLVNAIYFKGNWMSQFNPKATFVKQFQVSSTERILVDMMYQKGSFGYFEDQTLKCEVLSLPYVGNTLSMMVTLPDNSISLNDLESKINTEIVSSWRRSVRMQTVLVEFPRFKLEESFQLNDRLSSMGMADLFDPKKADLSGISGSNGSNQNKLYVSEVIHKAFIEVKEEGTEAAAATVPVLMTPSFKILRTQTFRADRPFIFTIIDASTEAILFLGRVVRPEKKCE